MRKLIRIAAPISLALAVLGLVAGAQLRIPADPEPRYREFTLTDVTIVNPLVDRRSGRALAVRDGKIVSIAEEGRSTPVGEVVADFAGHTVLPGIVNMHVHFPAYSPLGLTEYFGLLQVAHGVTTVREAGDMDGTTLAAARIAFEEEGRVGPRVFGCGPFVGGHDPRWTNSVVVESPDEAAAVVADLAESGARCIKLYDNLDPPRIRALAAAAEEAGIAAMGHVPFGFTYEEALIPDTQHLMGVARPEDIERGDHVVFRIVDWRRVDDARMDEVVAASRARGFAHTPTLVTNYQLRHFADYESARRDPEVMLLPRLFRDVAWSPVEGIPMYRGLEEEDHATVRDALAKKLVMVRKLHEAGVRLHVGTDTQQPFVIPGAGAHAEMRLFEQAGIEAEAVWAYATWRAADTLGVPDLGRIVEGAPADLLIFRDNPSRDLEAMKSLVAVVAAGRLYYREDLEASIEEFRAHYSGWLVDALSASVARRIIRNNVKRDH